MTDYVTFRLDGCDYATRIADVREVVRLAELTRLPGMSAPLAGILDLRGTSLPVLDIRSREASPGDVLVLNVDGTDYGFACDRVTAVLDTGLLPPEEGGAASGGALPGYVEQVLRGPDGAVFLVDVKAMAGDRALQAARAALPEAGLSESQT
ncbi:MAG TPA: chemotaxis protein CheW [Mycobacteriales bacterium]|nr:chemotaxis protein CheW [Mycobacteriales bacterium]